MWFGLAKMAMSTGAKVYANKQRQKRSYVTGGTFGGTENGIWRTRISR